MEINIASWNIWLYGSRDYKAIANVIRENKIDIIGVQEAAVYFEGSVVGSIAEKIAAELGYDFAFFPAGDNRPYRQWKMGNAIFSKFPIVKSNFFNLNPSEIKYDGNPENEQRILVASEILVGGKKINFLTTHLQYTQKLETSPIRVREVEKILSIIKNISGPTVLTGDFNTILETEEIKKIEQALNRVGNNKFTRIFCNPNDKAWSINGDGCKIDYIFLSRELNWKNFNIIESRVSDHLPIMATIDF